MTNNNIYKTINGTYRARKYVNGKRMSRNFTRLKDARMWINSFKTA